MGRNKFLSLIYRNFALGIAPCDFDQEVGDTQAIKVGGGVALPFSQKNIDYRRGVTRTTAENSKIVYDGWKRGELCSFMIEPSISCKSGTEYFPHGHNLLLSKN